jgi:hypothetical protein
MSRKLISNDLLLKIFLLGTISTKISKTKNLKGYFYAAVHDQLFYLQWCSDQAGAPSLRNYVSSSEKGLPCSVLFPLTSVATYICAKVCRKKNELFFKFLCNGCNIYSINIILTKFHHLKTSNNENIEIPKTLNWSVTNERTIWYRKYGRKVSWIVKWFGKYRRKLWKDMKNMEER